MLSFTAFYENESNLGPVARGLGKLGSGFGAVVGAGLGGTLGRDLASTPAGFLGGMATGGTVGFLGGEQLGRLIGRPIDWVIRKASPSEEEKNKTPETGAVVIPSSN